jgi:hypothetical protein
MFELMREGFSIRRPVKKTTCAVEILPGNGYKRGEGAS